MSLFKKDPIAAYEEEAVSHYTATFMGLSGDWVLKDLWHVCGMDNSTFKDAEFDPIRAAHRDGMQFVLKRLLGFSGRNPFNW